MKITMALMNGRLAIEMRGSLVGESRSPRVIHAAREKLVFAGRYYIISLLATDKVSNLQRQDNFLIFIVGFLFFFF